MQYFGIKVKQLRLARDMTQQELADRLEVTRATIGAYETGAQFPSVEALRRLAAFLDVSTDYLLGLTNEQQFDTSKLTDDQVYLILQMIEQFNYLNSQINH